MKDLKPNQTHSISELPEENFSYPDQATRQYLVRQAQLYEEKKQELLNQYAGQYIIFEEGKVLDADIDEGALIKRTYAKTGPRHLFVKKVLAQEPKLTAMKFVVSVEKI